MQSHSVSVVIPSRDRPESLLRAVESVLSTSPGVDIVCVLDDGDVESRAILPTLDAISVCIVTGEMHTAELWNIGAAFARRMNNANYFVIGADDVVFQPGWLEAAWNVMVSIGGSGLVGLNEGDGSAFGVMATHFMVSLKYAVRGLGGCIMIPSYRHGHTDAEATIRARRDGRLAWAEEARIQHLHPIYGTAPNDKIYEKGAASIPHDEALFLERMAAGFPDDFPPMLTYEAPPGWGTVAVALRSTKNVDTSFLGSWSQFLMFGVQLGDRLINIDIGANKPHHVAANKLIEAFLRTDCDSILFIDDDMTMPHDALSKMRDNVDNWQFDVAQGFCTYKTYPPHAVAYVLSDEQPGMPESLGGLKYNALAHLPDEGVEAVDAVGMAFTLVKRHVFVDMLGEHGPEYTDWFDFGKHSEMEDMRFSRRCREHGFTMCVDTSAKIKHLGQHAYGWPEHRQYVELLEKNSNG